MMKTKPTLLSFAAGLMLAGMALPAGVMAQGAGPSGTGERGVVEEQLAEEQMIDEEMQLSGEEEFVRYCSVCHGVDGKGSGALADTLKTPPADLTQISKRYGGFPLAKIADIIQNGGELKGHGSSDMPAWGEAFRDHVEPVLASAMIFELAMYLESIQEK